MNSAVFHRIFFLHIFKNLWKLVTRATNFSYFHHLLPLAFPAVTHTGVVSLRSNPPLKCFSLRYFCLIACLIVSLGYISPKRQRLENSCFFCTSVQSVSWDTKTMILQRLRGFIEYISSPYMLTHANFNCSSWQNLRNFTI